MQRAIPNQSKFSSLYFIRHFRDFFRPAKTAALAANQNVRIFPDEGNGLAIAVARKVADRISENNSKGRPTVLGLPTGNTPLDIYRELVRIHKEEGLDFSKAITFNLDEYFGMQNDNVNSYHRFMQENFFDFVNIDPKNIHIPDGTVARQKVDSHCADYERKIRNAGGLDIVLLGIGRNGHIGFNESGSLPTSKTRLVALDQSTRRSALPDFGEMRYVPFEALTVGVSTILSARHVILMATGEHKAPIIRDAIELPPTPKVTASFLQSHPNAEIYLDRAAASQLSSQKTPWLASSFKWDEPSAMRALCHLSEKLGKPIVEISRLELARNGMRFLLREFSLPEIKSRAANSLRQKIAERSSLPRDKRILVFSPHPDDDIISMGGTLRKLVENGNAVRVAYMTAGYTAVFDHAVESSLTLIEKFSKSFGGSSSNRDISSRISAFLSKKRQTQFGIPDSPEVLAMKRIIREAEAVSCCEFVGVNSCQFLNLPFYQTGRAKKMPIGEDDIDIVLDSIQGFKPDIIFAAGDLTDPNGTHRQCLAAIRHAIASFTSASEQSRPKLWLYSGAWSEFHPLESSALVPLSPDDVLRKREGIFRHQSQKDTAPQPGHQTDEFWQAAEKRNGATAKLMQTYGIGHYAAIEAFKIED